VREPRRSARLLRSVRKINSDGVLPVAQAFAVEAQGATDCLLKGMTAAARRLNCPQGHQRRRRSSCSVELFAMSAALPSASHGWTGFSVRRRTARAVSSPRWRKRVGLLDEGLNRAHLSCIAIPSGRQFPKCHSLRFSWRRPARPAGAGGAVLVGVPAAPVAAGLWPLPARCARGLRFARANRSHPDLLALLSVTNSSMLCTASRRAPQDRVHPAVLKFAPAAVADP